jgi:hypothetical protein
MSKYKTYAIPSEDGRVDVVVANPGDLQSPCYAHYSFAASAPLNRDELQDKRSIRLQSFRDWGLYRSTHPDVMLRLKSEDPYLPGSLALSAKTVNEFTQIRTSLRLGALELLANILSGRITSGDKDPFPHQLSLLQHVMGRSRKGMRLLIADEVGLGKTIEVGLILRDLYLEAGRLDQFSCLYLTSGGLREDVRTKLKTIFPGDVEDQNIVQTISSFRAYGAQHIYGIHVGSMHAARRYVTPASKKRIPSRVAPKVLVIDECHHCASNGDLFSESDVLSIQTTETYKAAYQMINGTYWPDSQPPELIIFMSATPFRSRAQFINLLKLLHHSSEEPGRSFSPTMNEAALVRCFKGSDSSSMIVWRQQEDVRSWRDQRLFPNLNVKTEYLPTSQEYLDHIKKIVKAVRTAHRRRNKSYGGFAIRQLEMRLTSSSVAAACWIFRWCVAHQSWKTKEEFRKDDSLATQRLRQLIVMISQRLCEINQRTDTKHSDVAFPGDGFTFEAKRISHGGKVDQIYDFFVSAQGAADEDDVLFTADADNIVDLVQLAIDLMALSGDQGTLGGVENAKLRWLSDKLEQNPTSRFLVFTESLQTCEIVQRSLSGRCEKLTGVMGASDRDRAVRRFRNPSNDVRVLVATSAADEGFDFQVADHVIHWDLSPSPAVLMQRNGRVARLGQIVDVQAYYLVMEGTHEQRRMLALQERFTNLGITDEKLRLKILGSLSKDDEDRIETAVKENNVQIIGNILDAARLDNEEMEHQLRRLHRELRASWVIDREALEQRLSNWASVGMRYLPKNDSSLVIKQDAWKRPVFGEQASLEDAQATIATIKWFHERPRAYVFDPEFKLFADDKEGLQLAGIAPWRKKTNNVLTKLRPAPFDLIGQIAQRFARLDQADFARLPRELLVNTDPGLYEADCLLFASHPLRELEAQESSRRYLTYYAFPAEGNEPINPEGANADVVHQVIRLLEDQRVAAEFTEQNLDLALRQGEQAHAWLETVRKMGGGFVDTGYFLPIPVALVSII